MSQTDVFILPSTGPAVVFDIIESEQHTDKSTVTDHPIEIGSNVSDHVRNEPTRISIKGVVTNTPIVRGDNGSTLQSMVLSAQTTVTRQTQKMTLNIPKPPTPLSIQGAISALGDLLFGTPPVVAQLNPFVAAHYPAATVQVQAFADPTFDNVLDTHNALTAIRQAGLICEVFTSTKAYDSMVIESIEYSKEDRGAGNFAVELRRIIQVSSAVVAAPVPLIKAGSPPAPSGNQTPENMSADEKRSLARKATGAVWDLASKALGGK